MAVKKTKAKPRPKSKTKVKAKTVVKSKVAVKAKSARKLPSKPKAKAKAKMILKKTTVKPGVKTKSENILKAKARAQAIMENGPEKILAKSVAVVKPPITPVVKRVLTPLVERRKPIKRSLRVNQFAFMKAPGIEHAFEVGDSVEVYCDHEKSRERIRGWIKGIVVQVDNKMVAVQFRSNVYLTDGWMVPDRILWYPVNSEHIRPMPGKKQVARKDLIPDY